MMLYKHMGRDQAKVGHTRRDRNQLLLSRGMAFCKVLI